MRWRTDVLLAAGLGLGCSATPSEPPGGLVRDDGPAPRHGAAERQPSEGEREGEGRPTTRVEGEGTQTAAKPDGKPAVAMQTALTTTEALTVGTLPASCRSAQGGVPRVSLDEGGQGSAAQEWMIVRRVVRMNRKAFKACGRPNLGSDESECTGHSFGVKLLVAADGSALAAGTDAAMPDAYETCVFEALGTLSFPQREGPLALRARITAY